MRRSVVRNGEFEAMLYYKPCRLRLSNDPADANQPVQVVHPFEHCAPGMVKLYHYSSEEWVTPLPLKKYWTACSTQNPEIAAAATGTGLPQCQWRLEWTSPIEYFDLNVEEHQERITRIVKLSEYKNLVIPKQKDIQSFKMQDATRTSKLSQFYQPDMTTPYGLDHRRPRGRVSRIIGWIRGRFV